MLDNQFEEWLLQSKCNVYISCIGEDGFPNVSVRKVRLHDESTLEYIDHVENRTVQLMMKNPRVIINLLSPQDPFHGYKMKGEVVFDHLQKSENDNFTPVRVYVRIKQMFPY